MAPQAAPQSSVDVGTKLRAIHVMYPAPPRCRVCRADRRSSQCDARTCWQPTDLLQRHQSPRPALPRLASE